MILNKRIKRVMLKNKGIYLGSIFLVMLSCLMYIVFNVTGFNLTENLNRFKDKYVLDDAKTVLAKPISNIKELEEKFNVKIEPRRTLDYELKKDVILRLFDKSTKVDIPYIKEGNDIKHDDEIILSYSFAKTNNIKIGDSIKIYGSELKVCGYVFLPDYIYPLKSETDIIDNPKEFGFGVVSKARMKEFGLFTTYYNIKYDDKSSKGIKKFLQANNGVITWQNVSENVRYSMAKVKIKSTVDMSLQIPSTVLFLTCLLLAIVMWRMIKEEFSQIGTLYALGYNKLEIVRHYLMFPSIISIGGAIFGTLFGVILARPTINYFIAYFNIPIINIIYSPKDILIAILLPLMFLIPAVMLVLRAALKYSPVSLMKGNAENFKTKKIEGIIKLKRFNFNTKFRIREITRNLSKVMLIILGVVMSSFMVLFALVAQSSINYIMNKEQNNMIKYQYNYMLNSMQQKNNYGGEAYNVTYFKDKKGNNFFVYGLHTDSKMINIKNLKNDKMSFDKVVITKALADVLAVKKGEMLSVKNKINEKLYNIKIDDIANVYTTNAIYMPIEKLNKILHYDKGSFNGIFSKSKLKISKSSILMYQSKDEMEKSMKTMVEPLKVTLLSMGALAFIIALIVIYVIISITVDESKRSISMLKVLGYNIKEISRLVLNTNGIFVIIGYIVSIPLTLNSMDMLFKSSTKGMNITFPIVIEPIYAVVGFAIIYLAYVTAKFFAKNKVLAISMVESMKSQRE